MDKTRIRDLSAPEVAGLFSPLREFLGFDARELSPCLVAQITFATAETRSFKRAVLVLDKVGGAKVSINSIQRVVGDVGGSMKGSRDFGRQMAREAKRRRFQEALGKVFLGDWLACKWSIWKEHVQNYTSILDFIHPLSYLFLAAKTIHSGADEDVWSRHLAWMRGCWQGEAGMTSRGSISM